MESQTMLEDEDTLPEIEEESTVELEVPSFDEEEEKKVEAPEGSEEDEEKNYGKRAQKRIRDLVRREKEAKELLESERKAKADLEEKFKQASSRLETSEKTTLDESERGLKASLEAIKAKYLDAHESGDASAMFDAQNSIASIQAKLNNIEAVKAFRSRTPQKKEEVVEEPQVPRLAPKVQQRAVRWANANKDWFGLDKRMTSVALSIGEELEGEGYDPHDLEGDDGAEAYYRELDKRLREFAPAYKWGETQKVPVKRPIVSNSSNSSGRKTVQVKLTSDQRNAARELGISEESYAKALLKMNKETS